MVYTILIVDDSKLARMAVSKALSTLQPDWHRIEASNADEAFALVQQSPVDVALLDFNMPGRDGLTLAADLRRLNPALPIAVITANHQDEIVNRAHEVGVAFLTKPLKEQAIAAFLAKAVQHLEAAD